MISLRFSGKIIVQTQLELIGLVVRPWATERRGFLLLIFQNIGIKEKEDNETVKYSQNKFAYK